MRSVHVKLDEKIPGKNMLIKAKKDTVNAISSSSWSSSEEETRSEESEDSDSSYDDSVVEISSSTSCHDEDSEDFDNEENELTDEDSRRNRVIQLLEENCDLLVLRLMECKAYLRRHGLRISGSRAECIERIKEHWRLKDGNGEVLYPRSTFKINCTGDVCRGDVVLFTQKVYKNFLIFNRLFAAITSDYILEADRSWKSGIISDRVEVLWSKGVKKLPALFPLLIKGRNLYRMKTFRQHWGDEKERSKVLEEKHKRGAAARSIRERHRSKAAMRKRSTSDTTEGRKRQKKFEHSRPCQIVRPRVEGGKLVEECRKPVKQSKKCYWKTTMVRPLDMKKTRNLSAHTPHPSYTHTCPYEVGPSSSQLLPYTKCMYTSHPYETYHRNLTRFSLEQNHREAPFFVSSGSLSRLSRPDVHHLPASANREFFNFDHHQYHSQLSQRTGWGNSGLLSGQATYPERTHHLFHR